MSTTTGSTGRLTPPTSSSTSREVTPESLPPSSPPAIPSSDDSSDEISNATVTRFVPIPHVAVPSDRFDASHALEVLRWLADRPIEERQEIQGKLWRDFDMEHCPACRSEYLSDSPLVEGAPEPFFLQNGGV
ncbi:hypothetical protein QFC24_001014 [Naganishia onofrii]|uniref:Uncharacterized protein n=1 Tax=Naganishia onofrii TaxID=1851511 RepID=A0ACC2XW93_9TREE|nr:hypothetical protein QFC24_001014 [Naganishia onofrii]